ncbi:TadE family type IV pilus minor pilin [Actinomyces respiraculi]|uniref:TadE family type IV pilus minor pilin n=1 Tax=Actinomyces respiraculi TaxID=2744574 RepID=UPI001421ECBB|nr:TadE family type IV pilus minor pilin [Actinomyces respiraculi]
MVTAETAVTMPAVAIVLILVLSGVSVGVTQLRVADAARVAARAAAIGETDLTGPALRAAGEVELSVSTEGGLTCVSASRAVPGPLGAAGVYARSRACAWTEPGPP